MAARSRSTQIGAQGGQSSCRFAPLPLLRCAFASLNTHLWLAVPFLAIPALLPFWRFGLNQSADGDVHLLRLALLDYHIGHGILYPRWFPELRLGNGYPVLNYYSPLTYYLAEAWHLIGLDHSGALMAALALLILVAGWGAFCLAKDLFGREHGPAALVAATAYMYAPYLLTNVFVRGAVAEVGAQALLPWLLWSMRRLMRAERPVAFVLPAVLSLAALPLTHNITILLAPLLLIPYVFVAWWQAGRQPARWLWLGAGVALAMGLSAFFWVPMVAEPGYLSEQAYQTARQISMPENAWHWHTFLNIGLLYGYRWASPYQLGAGQLLLALAGFLLARRRDTEWLLLALLAVVYSLLIGAWAVSLWQLSPVLLIVQFPWRLLSLVSLPVALLTGGVVLHVRPGWLRAGATTIVLACIIYFNLPRLDGMLSEILPAYSGDITLAQIAHYETVEGIAGSSDTMEFRPRWAAADQYEPEPGLSAAPLTVEPLRGNAFATQATVTSATGGALRFASLYFPSWHVTLDNQIVLPVYPSTRLGLLTVDLPPGKHQVRVMWAGGVFERWATVVSLASLAVLAWLIWRVGPRWLSLLPVALFLTSVGLLLRPAPLQAVHAPVQPLTSHDLRLVGYRTELQQPGSLIIFPYWYVSSQPGHLRVRWQLRDSRGMVINEIKQEPWYNSGRASDWPPGTLVDDAYELPLPPGLPAGQYQLYAQLDNENDAEPLQLVGPVELPEPIRVLQELAPDYAMGSRVGTAILVGYDMAVNGRRISQGENADRPVAVRPGDSLDYTLYWRAAGPLEQDYGARIEIVSPTGRGVRGDAHLAGAPWRPTTLWERYSLIRDHYHLVVPAETAPKLYQMQLRFYEQLPLRLLNFASANGQVTGDYASLRPIKVARTGTYAPQYPLDIRIGEMATVLGYDLDPNEPVLHPGSQFTVTLHYRVARPTSADYTRFLHLASPDLGMVAQLDTYPADGENPTHSWMPGETIVDPVRLTVAEDAQPGDYVLTGGFYDLQADLARIPLRNGDGQPLPENEFELGTMTVYP
jgi:hypothetical protein